MALARTAPLREEIERLFPERPFDVEFWDGSALPSTESDAPDSASMQKSGRGGPAFIVKSPKAVAHALLAPGQLGLGRAYASGDLVVSDLDQVMRLLDDWEPPPLETTDKLKLAGAAARAVGLTVPPRPPAAELKPRGRRHTPARDRRAVRHHYDVSNDFFALFLDQSMTYSCAIFSRGASTLEEAQVAKNELVCTKLALKEGDRVLDIGSGWGAFAIHAAKEHGTHVTGITLSEPQAAGATERARAAGVEDLVEFRVQDYRELRGERFDALASIGMVEHVGEEQIDVYARQLASLIEPGGRLLNHGIARLRHSDPAAGAFSERYVFPDADPLHLSRISLALERAGFQPNHVEDFREDYAETLRHWARRLDDNLDEATRIAGPERVRVWRLYLRAARNGFETGFTSVYQVLADRA